MKLKEELKKLEESIDYNIINLKGNDFVEVVTRLLFFKIYEYDDIIMKLNTERYAQDSYDKKVSFNSKYIEVYKSSRKVYYRLVNNIKNQKMSVKYPSDFELHKKEVYDYLSKYLKVDKEKSLNENVLMYIKLKIIQKISEINIEISKLNKLPSFYINTFSTFIGPCSPAKYDNDIYFYKDVFIMQSELGHFSIFYSEKSTESSKNTLLNILAYFNGQPYFYFTENYDFNRKICDLYEQFDLLDLLRLRKKNYFNCKKEERFYIEKPIIKSNKKDVIYFAESDYEILFELYHASLKQFESLPRCVFLYRVFEYGSQKHYEVLMHPTNYKPEDAINYYVEKIMTHNFNPLYYVDFGDCISEDGKNIIRKRKPQYVNFISKLKEETKRIKIEWSKHSYLKDKSIGEIIYCTGRNATAHGASGRRTARYDYAQNYKHINDVNVFLELIARYLIEVLNPQLSNMVERRKMCYIKYNQYEKIFDIEK